MSGIKLKKAGFVLLASLMMTTAVPAFAQMEVGNAPLPEVEVDGSVLQQLDPSAGTTQSMTPVNLVPPASLNRKATSNSAPMLTDTMELDPSGSKDVAIDAHPALTPPAPVVAKVIVPADAPPTPSLETQSVASRNMPEKVTPVDNNKDDSDTESFLSHFTAPVATLFSPSKKVEPTATISDAPMLQAGTVSTKPDNLASEDRPAIIPLKKITKPVEVVAAKPAPKMDLSPVTSVAEAPVPKPAVKPVQKPVVAAVIPPADSNVVTQVVMDVPGIAMPTAPLMPVPKKDVVAVDKPVAQKPAEDIDLTAPPKVMAETEGLKAAVSKPVMFPISSKSKTRGDIDPEITKTSEAKTPMAPVIPHPETKAALSNAMSDASVAKPEQVAVAEPAPKQAVPEIIYSKVPVPKPRPNVIVASKDFVEQARRTYEDTYKVVKRDGDAMPAVGAQKVSKEALPPVRMSVADIATDPLASKLVAMTPDDIASTLNGMAPAAGNAKPDSGSRIVDESISTNKHIRIVRENGNWTPRKPVAQTASTDASGAVTPPSADGHYNIAFQSGATDLPATSYGEVDSGVVNALRADSNARVQIVAFASAADGKDTTAKRTSLSRALSIRSYMISKGIDATRVDVRAMGIQQDSKTAPDQVQMILVPADAKKS